MCGWFKLEMVLASRSNRCLIGVRGDMLGQDLDGDGAVQAGVAGFVDFAHAALTPVWK